MHFHTVLFQFADGTPAQEIEQVCDKLREMTAIPAVRQITVGPNLMPVTDGWTHGMTMVFDSFDSMMSEFADHPLHQAVVREQVPRFSRYMAMDVQSA